jgi:hypothetical protein
MGEMPASTQAKNNIHLVAAFIPGGFIFTVGRRLIGLL